MPAPVFAAAYYWARPAAEWRDSGLTQAQFCRRRAEPLHTFRARLYRRPRTESAPDRS